jgi:Uma2 family endonuclease
LGHCQAAWSLAGGEQMSDLKTRPITDTWVIASWEAYLRLLENPLYEKAKGYYYKGHMRLEMSPVGFDHGRDHTIVSTAIGLFAGLKGILLTGVDNTTFRKSGLQECQPDMAYYLDDNAEIIPKGTNVVDLEQYPPPNLVVEIAKTSLLDDQGTKRLLYEDLGVSEYWIVDVEKAEITGFSIADRGSKRIAHSQVLPGLSLEVVEEALRRNQQAAQSLAIAWLINQFQRQGD